MLPAPLRLIAVAILSASAAFLLIYQQWLWGSVAAFFAITLAYIQFRLGPVVSALRYLYRGDTRRCEKELKRVKRPEKLPLQLQGYYHFCHGYLYTQKGNLPLAATAFRTALDKGIRLDNDKAVAHVSIAHAEASAGKKAEARKHLKAAKELPHNEAVAQAITQVERML